jgi:large subunit ribosomal protein L18
MSTDSKQQRRLRRAVKTHAKARISGKPRLLVFKSLKAIYAQIIDDATGKIVCGASSLKGKSGKDGAAEVGVKIAELAKSNKVESVSFDRNGYLYHGNIKALADSAREAGLKF